MCTCRRRANVPSLQVDQSYSVALQNPAGEIRNALTLQNPTSLRPPEVFKEGGHQSVRHVEATAAFRQLCALQVVYAEQTR